MSLELHIWGPAFGLPSIDPDCLAAVAYFSLAVPRDGWTLVATSPSALPRVLPALRDGRLRKWVAAGFEDIVAYLREGDQAADDLDAGLTRIQAADSTAYCAFLHAEAAPLLALSLYVSSANWSATTRPAYSQVLPFPLTWIEPSAVRAEHSTGAAHLGLTSLDTDEDDEQTSASALNFSSSLSAAALQVFPDRLRTARRREAGEGGPAPGSSKAPISSALTPEARAQIRLDETARACLSVLAERKANKRLFLRPDCTTDETARLPALLLHPSSLDCLAFGYLALMTVPDVPRPFLRDALRRHYPGLADFVADMRQAAFGCDGQKGQKGRKESLLSLTPSHLNPLWLRTVHGIIHGIPGFSGEWLVWLYRVIRLDDSDDENGRNPWRQDVAAARRRRIVALCSTLTGAALAVGLLLGYRNLPPFGAPVVVYSRLPQTSLLGLGAAGVILSSL
ncbi:mitochondrial import receptor subunit [Grosmannia clavigera kw1407]|uniref:Mitochondrial import receptor subunit n=1 Tax=Grosmannia clavigera (strain kw1407 / UAMH 11150) TaxID=655863 RepID=F0XU37_GROCL|nr:mitochondrial import receptor subunit [Grosmannia clavigera kw1407]EFW98766.1 mitochondrial import receptor subunit [Grosmannia clavigera kw1407]